MWAQAIKFREKEGPASRAQICLVINKIELAPLVGADLGVMDRDAKKMRGTRPFVFANVQKDDGVDAIINFIIEAGGLKQS